MTIRKKIMSGYAIMVCIGLILGIVGLITSNLLTGKSRELFTFQKENISLSNVLNAHIVWREGLIESVLAGAPFTGALDPTLCALGRWSDSDEAKAIEDRVVLGLLRDLNAPHAAMHAEAGVLVNLLNQGENEQAGEMLISSTIPITQEVISLLNDIGSRYVVLIQDKSHEIDGFGSTMSRVIVVFILVALAACALLVWKITASIVKPLLPLNNYMKRAATTGEIILSQEEMGIIDAISSVNDEIGETICSCAEFLSHVVDISRVLVIMASGDLSPEISKLSEKDIIGSSLQKMMDNMNTMFQDIHISADQVSVGSKQVADGASTLSRGSTEQADTITELSNAIAELAQKTKSNAEMADKAARLAETIKANAQSGNQHMNDMTDAVNDINEASSSISKVIKVIDDIAFQTNILALNAAVEAARAGAAGKGFAVVAEEVRNLAAKSAEAAKDTSSLIENSIEKATLGVRIAGETAESLAGIVDGINESTQLVVEIARSSEEQAHSIHQINAGVDQVAQVVQLNSATAEESAAASDEMSTQSVMLQDLISQFKLRAEYASYRSLPPSDKGASRLAIPEVAEDYSDAEPYAYETSANPYSKY